MAETKEITGFVAVSQNQYGSVLKVTGDNGMTRTIYVGEQYAAENIPPNGAYGNFVFQEYPAKPGRNYGSKYLESWDPKAPPQPQAAPNGNGAAPARAPYIDHHGSIAAEWAVGRAVELCCAEAQFARERDYNIEAIARELLGMAQDLEVFVGVGKDGWAKVEAKPAEPEPA